MKSGKSLVIIVFLLILGLYFAACRKDIPIGSFSPSPVTLLKPHGFNPLLPVDNNPLTREGIELGRRLFYDPILSGDGTQSCASCHHQKDAFTDNGLKVSTGIKGIAGTRNSMPLFNLNWHDKGFFWDGRAATLRDQILMPIEDPVEMASSVNDALNRVNASAQYNTLFYKAFGKKTASRVELAKAIEHF